MRGFVPCVSAALQRQSQPIDGKQLVATVLARSVRQRVKTEHFFHANPHHEKKISDFPAAPIPNDLRVIFVLTFS
jgi:hypothetical protein